MDECNLVRVFMRMSKEVESGILRKEYVRHYVSADHSLNSVRILVKEAFSVHSTCVIYNYAESMIRKDVSNLLTYCK